MAGCVSRLRRVLVLLPLAVGLSAAPLRAQPPAGEADAKVRFTLTLARFVQWPADMERASLRLCVLQRSPALAAAFASRQGTVVTGRVLEVLGGDAVRTARCDLLFVDASAGGAGAEALAAVAGRPVLTLGTVDGFASHGGMVELVNVDDALRFDVNLAPLRAAHLGLSSQALKLARRVQE
ncbi:YfiR family protein [Piscinibacter sp.]|uniref:YfiR family protein n=1 Tax=Piscinibacter sp. TaxID=1903157 RepID=UPI0035AE08AF